MTALPLPPDSMDLVWCEGAAYFMGVAAALDAWWRLLHPGGACAFSEAVWLRPDPPTAVRACWEEYPAMADVEACRGLIDARGFRRRGDFVLPASAWWDDYYRPMSARVTELEARYRDDAAALAVLAACRDEVEVYREYADWYGYAFFVAKKPGSA